MISYLISYHSTCSIFRGKKIGIFEGGPGISGFLMQNYVCLSYEWMSQIWMHSIKGNRSYDRLKKLLQTPECKYLIEVCDLGRRISQKSISLRPCETGCIQWLSCHLIMLCGCGTHTICMFSNIVHVEKSKDNKTQYDRA